MTTPAPPRSLRDLRHLTPARVGLGRAGASLPTSALLEFTLDHARARDAVHAELDISAIAAGLDALGLQALQVSSCAQSRKDYLRRPDLGRKLDAASQDLLASGQRGPCDLAVVIGDGLSPSAVNAHAVELAAQSRCECWRPAGSNSVPSSSRRARGSRWAMKSARFSARAWPLMLIGERPGLSAPHSLGAYLTFAPKAGCTDAMRNCVSNIHSSGLSYDEAAFKIAWLVREGLARGVRRE